MPKNRLIIQWKNESGSLAANEMTDSFIAKTINAAQKILSKRVKVNIKSATFYNDDLEKFVLIGKDRNW